MITCMREVAAEARAQKRAITTGGANWWNTMGESGGHFLSLHHKAEKSGIVTTDRSATRLRVLINWSWGIVYAGHAIFCKLHSGSAASNRRLVVTSLLHGVVGGRSAWPFSPVVDTVLLD